MAVAAGGGVAVGGGGGGSVGFKVAVGTLVGGLGVGEGTSVQVGVAVALGVGVAVNVGVNVGLGVLVGVGVGGGAKGEQAALASRATDKIPVTPAASRVKVLFVILTFVISTLIAIYYARPSWHAFAVL
ncbi:MAG: hypothetical protein HY871_02320 [Chloroflexi bacterium]|nr:hypothetical protein [Chloroflexota bacterium]